MKRSVSKWQFIGFVSASVGGILLHYLYEWTNKNAVAAVFSGVNESTWEHMKLLFFPLFIFAIVQSFFFKEYEDFWCIKLRGILLGIILIPVLFYTFNGAFGKSPDWLNIAFFFVSAAVSFIYETRRMKREDVMCISPKLSFAVLCIIAVAFAVFTFLTPEIPLFKDPLTETYGI